LFPCGYRMPAAEPAEQHPRGPVGPGPSNRVTECCGIGAHRLPRAYRALVAPYIATRSAGRPVCPSFRPRVTAARLCREVGASCGNEAVEQPPVPHSPRRFSVSNALFMRTPNFACDGRKRPAQTRFRTAVGCHLLARRRSPYTTWSMTRRAFVDWSAGHRRDIPAADLDAGPPIVPAGSVTSPKRLPRRRASRHRCWSARPLGAEDQRVGCRVKLFTVACCTAGAVDSMGMVRPAAHSGA